MRKYDDCFYCGGVVEEQLLQRDLYVKKYPIVIIRKVPTGVCTQCGEKFIKPDVAKSIDVILNDENKQPTYIKVPTFEFSSVA